MSKPVAGQWYENLGTRQHCIAVSESAGECVMQWKNGDFEIVEESDYEDLKHLPDCTGWDWEQETFPQYWTANHESRAFIRRDSFTRTVSVWRDGHEGAWLSEWDKAEARSRTRLTEAEALALLDPKPQPAEDPGEWVDLPADHRIRAEIDWYDYGGFFDYVCKGSSLIGVRVGDTQAKKARCRRKDLPAPKPKRTVTVPKWLCRSWGNWQVLECSKPIGFEEVHRVGETTYEID